MQNRDPILTAHYLERADQFLNAMKLLGDDLRSYRTSVGLLAVHSAISLNDAIVAGVTGTRSKYEDHSSAAQELHRICNELQIENTKGVQHFTWLLGKKSHIAYGDQRLTDGLLQLSVDRAEKFSNWAYTYFREVLRVETES
jgi:hypothetical protein